MSKPRRSRTARLDGEGTAIERWTFDDDSHAHRCSWPTSESARRLADDAAPEVRAVLGAYAWLTNHPLGVEYAVRHLRDIHRAEREGGFNDER